MKPFSRLTVLGSFGMLAVAFGTWTGSITYCKHLVLAAETVDKTEGDKEEKSAGSEKESTDSPESNLEKKVIEFFKKNQLFPKNRYAPLRALFSSDFEQRHQSDILQAFTLDHEAMMTWLDKRPDIKEELFTAINESKDNVPEALNLFFNIWKKFPDKAESHAQLAIAVAVVWDQDKNVYDFDHHQRRTHSNLPPKQTGAMDAFQLLAENKQLPFARDLPWEFLVHVVNHKTPVAEREWALENYANKRKSIGACYSAVPYDDDMLYRDSPKLRGHDYTLENILKIGGVCAMQADYSARVSKSLAIPAEYVRGMGNSGGLHAWVMWAEIKQATPKSISFTLMSHGRYNIDNYYTGELDDPQTGEEILDRDLERKLAGVGADWQVYRQAQLLMRAYPMIRDAEKLDLAGQLKYLDTIVQLCPYNENAWLEIARMARDGVLGQKHVRVMNALLKKLVDVYGQNPDFIWNVFDDLVKVQDNFKQRVKLFEQAIDLFIKGKRPDLACAARLKLAEYQMTEERWQDAADGLATTIEAFPDEGRYMPALVEKLEACGPNLKGGDSLVSDFFMKRYLPKIPRRRGNDASDYCIAMFERAIAYFEKQGEDANAAKIRSELAALKGGSGKPRK